MGEEVTVTPSDLDRLANTLTSSLDGIRDSAGTPASEVDAGVSTGVVSQAMATIYDSIARMTADTEKQANEVTNAGGVYTRSDAQAASELPPLPFPTDGSTGGR